MRVKGLGIRDQVLGFKVGEIRGLGFGDQGLRVWRH